MSHLNEHRFSQNFKNYIYHFKNYMHMQPSGGVNINFFSFIVNSTTVLEYFS